MHAASEGRVLELARWQVAKEPGSWPVNSDYVSLFWLPLLGPTSLLLLQRLDRLVGDARGLVPVLEDELAASLGLGSASTRRQLLARAVTRLIDFHALREPAPSLLEVPAHLPSLSRGQRRRLPPSLIRLADPSMTQQCHHARTQARHEQLRRTLVDLGLEESEVHATLVRLGYQEVPSWPPAPRGSAGR